MELSRYLFSVGGSSPNSIKCCCLPSGQCGKKVSSKMVVALIKMCPVYSSDAIEAKTLIAGRLSEINHSLRFRG